MKRGVIALTIGAALFAGVFSTSVSAREAQGIGVGNGGSTNRAQYIEKLKSEMFGAQRNASGPLDDLYDWCSRVTRVLGRELSRAELQIQYERMESAKEILMDALVAASQSLDMDPQTGSPTIKRMIDRGVIYADALGQELSKNGSSRLDSLTELHFLTGYIQLIIKTENELDRPFYLPYVHRYNRCGSCPPEFNLPAFMRKYFEIAKAELRFILTQFTNMDNVGGRLMVTPVGNPIAFLKLAELGSGFIADEIANTFDSYRNACSIRDLVALSETLRDFNVFGDRTVFPNVPWALTQSAVELDRILMELGSIRPNPIGGNEGVQTVELLSGSLHLDEAEMKSVRLGGTTAIQKLFVQAEAYRSDATIEVIVNGEVKGTLYLPARDPSYVVTIADTAGSIEFRHVRGGRVQIRSVRAVISN
ncbi:MAG: hypothetical protein AABZ06_05750 [Bdellovibrionota bacterium]